MKHFLESKKLYVKNDDNFIYEVSTFELNDDSNVIYYDLNLVAGWDYIDPDTSDIQGYVKAERFIEDVQYERLLQYFFQESLMECVEENGYVVLDKLPEIH